MKVTVIDYGLSNLLSVQHAFAHFGAEVQVTSSPADVLAADALVLPGVGAFQDGMQGLEQLGLIEPIKHEAMIMEFLRAHGAIRRADVMELCGLTGDQAGKLLAKLATAGKVLKRGKSNRGRYYTLPQASSNNLK